MFSSKTLFGYQEKCEIRPILKSAQNKELNPWQVCHVPAHAAPAQPVFFHFHLFLT